LNVRAVSRWRSTYPKRDRTEDNERRQIDSQEKEGTAVQSGRHAGGYDRCPTAHIVQPESLYHADGDGYENTKQKQRWQDVLERPSETASLGTPAQANRPQLQ